MTRRPSSTFALVSLVWLLASSTSTVAQQPIQGLTEFERLRNLVARDAEGFESVGPAHTETLSPGSEVERRLPIAAGRCFRLLGAGAEGLVVNAQVGELRADSAADATLTMQGQALCGVAGVTYTLRLQAREGRGRFVWRLYGAAAPAAEVDRAEHVEVGGSESDYIADQIRRGHGRAADGRPAMGEVERRTLRRSETFEQTVSVRAGQCVVVVASGVPSVRRLSVQLLDAFGSELGTGESRRGSAAVRVCAQSVGTWKVRVKVELGYGEVGVQLFAGPR